MAKEEETPVEEVAGEAPTQRGVFVSLTPNENGEDEISLHPVNVDPLGVPTLVLMAANLVKRNLGM